MLRRSFIASAILLLLSACVSPSNRWQRGPAVGLPANVLTMLNAADIPPDAVGAIVIRVSDGAIVLSHQAGVSLQPASTLKLVTSIVGLERLGPTYRGRAELRTNAELVDGVLPGDLTLRGDLVLRGVGNPDLDWQAFQRMLQTLRHTGISDIEGDLILDRQWFQPSRPDVGVPPFDEAPEFRYNVIPDALLLNTNLLQFDLESVERENATTLRVGVSPALDEIQWCQT